MSFTFPTLAAIALTFFACCLVAFPLSLDTRAIDPGLFTNLNFFSQFAAAAYCSNNNNVPAGGPKLTCTAGICPLVEANEVTTVYEFENSLVTDVTGYIAVDRTRNITVLAFRGSRSIRNYIADVDFVPVPTDICFGCTAHQGFWNSWLEARDGVLKTLMNTAKQNPSSKVVVVGHSLGGAIADFAAAEIRKQGVTVDLYTYGAPRIAGTVLSDFITNQNRGGNFRSTHYNDPVPRLPPIVLGSVHISPEYWITTPNGVVPTPNDIQRLDGNINKNGNTGQTKLDVNAHYYYFGPISSCTPNDGIEVKRAEKACNTNPQPGGPSPEAKRSFDTRCSNVPNAF
ncbi:hypothetical protein MMC07_008616 [Pseudocyphellaria aurata]|nr:hypothetical protein [Pseudocyphellaria aurata]